MIFKLEFSDEQCKELLTRIGYKTEIVKLYFYRDDNPYGICQEFVGYEYKVCYKGEKPKELCVEYPLLDECVKYLYDNVMKETLNNWIFNVMLQHNPFSCEHN